MKLFTIVYDVIVIGGGPAGLMAANIFEQHHINYVLLEKMKNQEKTSHNRWKKVQRH
nr:FAD-dependent monooxygenase [Acholeplasma laidlawii]